MLLNQSSLESVHRFCHRNRPLLEKSSSAGCVHCGATFTPAEIREWVREAGPDGPASETAKCPRCGTDSVLPSAAPVLLDARTLAAIQAYWFSGRR